MESRGQANRIQVSRAVRERLPDRYRLEAHGEIELKGLGRMPTRFLTGRRHA